MRSELKHSCDLRASERTFLEAMQRLQFGRYDWVQVREGELVLDPWPNCVQHVKFGAEQELTLNHVLADFELKRHVVEFFRYVRSVERGRVLNIEVRHGLPVTMDLEITASAPGLAAGATA